MLKQKTVYFREEDLPKWEAIKNKAEWLHFKLNDGEHTLAAHGTKFTATKPLVIKTKQDAVQAVKEVFPDTKPITYKKTSNWGA